MVGRDADGRRVVLSRSISASLYRCPSCHGEITIGDDHVLVRYPDAEEWDHHHWHRGCVEEMLLGELRAVKRIGADRAGRSAGARRAAARKRRQRR